MSQGPGPALAVDAVLDESDGAVAAEDVHPSGVVVQGLATGREGIGLYSNMLNYFYVAKRGK